MDGSLTSIEASTETPRPVVLITGPSVEPTIAQKNIVAKMEPKISQFVTERLKDQASLDRFRSAREKIVTEVTRMNPRLAEKIMKDMDIALNGDDAFIAYDIMGVTENFGVIFREKLPSDDEQRRAIQQRADTLANYIYDPRLSEAENMERLNTILAVLK